MPTDELVRSGVFRNRAPAQDNIAFVIMPFDESFDDVYEIVKRAASDSDFECFRADDEAAPGRITDTIYQGIYDASVVIADLTGRNPNVFYELGLAHAISDNVILITQDIDDVPFDVKQFRLIPYANSIGGGIQLSKDLTQAIGAISSGTQPRSHPLDVRDLGGKTDDAVGWTDQPTFTLLSMVEVAITGGDEQLAREGLSDLLRRREEGERFGADELASIAVSAELLNDPQGARGLFEEAFAQDPENEGVRLSYASFLVDLERPTQADLDLASDLLDHSFANRVWEQKIRAQLAMSAGEDPGEAVDEIVRAYVSDPSVDPGGLLELFDQLGRRDDAREMIDAWVELNPDEELRGRRYLADLLRNSEDQEDKVFVFACPASSGRGIRAPPNITTVDSIPASCITISGFNNSS